MMQNVDILVMEIFMTLLSRHDFETSVILSLLKNYDHTRMRMNQIAQGSPGLYQFDSKAVVEIHFSSQTGIKMQHWN